MYVKSSANGLDHIQRPERMSYTRLIETLSFQVLEFNQNLFNELVNLVLLLLKDQKDHFLMHFLVFHYHIGFLAHGVTPSISFWFAEIGKRGK